MVFAQFRSIFLRYSALHIYSIFAVAFLLKLINYSLFFFRYDFQNKKHFFQRQNNIKKGGQVKGKNENPY